MLLLYYTISIILKFQQDVVDIKCGLFIGINGCIFVRY